jgi:hypothetical protein
MANEFKVKKGLIVQGSGSVILDIQGSQGQLFSVTDNLSGSLFSVNDISGLPILQVSSDDSVKLGTFNAEAIKVSGSVAIITGSFSGSFSGNAFVQNGNSFGATAVLGTNDTQNLALETSGSTRLFISSSGNVGIGTTTPTVKLEVNGNVTTGAVLNIGGATGNVGELNFFNNVVKIARTSTSGLDFYTTGGQPGLSLTSTSLFGIGTTTPNAKLDVSGSAIISGSLALTGNITGSNALFTGTITAQKLVVQTVTSSILYSSGSNIFGSQLTDIQSFTGSLRVTGSGNHYVVGGNVGIGTTSPTYKLHISSSNNNDSLAIHYIANNSTLFPFIISSNTDAVGNYVRINTAIIELKRAGAASTIRTVGSANPLNLQTDAGDIVILPNQIETLRVGPNTLNISGSVNISGSGTQIPFQITSGSTSLMFVSSSGNVGIGKTTPNAKLDVSGSAIISGSLTATGNSLFSGQLTVGGALNSGQYYAATSAQMNNIYGGRSDFASSGISFNTLTPAQSVMVINYLGNVGIGTTTPNAKLDVSGSAIISGSLTVTGDITGSISNAISASYATTAGNGGVTKIIAGGGITLSPSSGLGDVQINSSAATYNTATGSYGSFYDTGSILATSATTLYSMSLSTTDISNGVYVSGSNNSQINFTNAGTYNIQFSAQFSNTDNSNQDVVVWARKNGTDIPDSSGTVGVPPFKAGSNGQALASWNYYLNLSANDYIQLCWHTEQANVITLETIAAGTSPVHPRTPSLILTAQRVDTFLSNTGSFTGTFTGNITGSDAIFSGTITAQKLVVQTITSSVLYSSGSNQFGSQLTDIQSFTGSLRVTGSGNHYVMGGNVGIGTTAPTAKLDVSGSTITSGLTINASRTGGNILIDTGYGRNIGMPTNPAGGSTGRIAWSLYGDNVQNSSAYIVGSTDGASIGISTMNPNARLDVSGSVNISGSGTQIPFQITSGSTSLMYVSSSGNVGINYATPTMKIDINTIASNDGVNVRQGGTTIAQLRNVSGGNEGALSLSANGSIKVFIRASSDSWITNSLGIRTTTPNATLDVSGSVNISGSGTQIPFQITSGSTSLMFVSSSGNVGIGTTTPLNSFEVSGQSIRWGTGAGNYADIRVPNNSRLGIRIDNSGNRFYGQASFRSSGGSELMFLSDTGNLGIGTTSPSASFHVAGTTLLSSSFNTGVSGSTLKVQGSGSALPIFTVVGSQGELFSINDSLSGSLFSVNDISGLPILEVFSDNTILLGNYQAPTLYTTNRIASTALGSNIVYSFPTSSYDGVFMDYTVKSGSNARAGNFAAIWSGTAVNYMDNSTTDFGSTAGMVLSGSISGSNLVVFVSGSSAGWTFKGIIKSI